MIKPHRGPVLGDMAIGAFITGCRVIGLFTGGNPVVMTGRTGFWGSLKDAAYMAGIAGDLYMSSGERKTGCIVIEPLQGIDVCGEILCIGQSGEADKCKQQQRA